MSIYSVVAIYNRILNCLVVKAAQQDIFPFRSSRYFFEIGVCLCWIIADKEASLESLQEHRVTTDELCHFVLGEYNRSLKQIMLVHCFRWHGHVSWISMGRLLWCALFKRILVFHFRWFESPRQCSPTTSLSATICTPISMRKLCVSTCPY